MLDRLTIDVALHIVRNIKDNVQAYYNNERHNGPSYYCVHGNYTGDPYGPDYICGLCEDGVNVYAYALDNAKARVATYNRTQELYDAITRELGHTPPKVQDEMEYQRSLLWE